MFAKGASPRFIGRAVGIIIVGFLTMYFSCALGADCLNVIQPAFEEKFGWSYTSITLPVTIGAYVVIAAAFVYSTIIMKHGTRIFSAVSFGVLAAATVMIGVAYNSEGSFSFILLVAGQFLSRIFVQAVQLCCFQVCANWFVKTRGRVMGVIMMACALDNATATAIMTKTTAKIGFGNTYFVIAAILVLVAVLAYIYYISSPQEVGLCADGIESEAGAGAAAETEAEQGAFQTKWTLKKLLKCPESWAIMLGFGIFNMAITAVVTEYIIRMQEMNISVDKALIMLSAAGILGIFASPLYGILIDKIGAPKAAALLAIFDTAMMLGFRFGSSENMWLVYIAIAGIALFAGTPTLHPSVTIHVFGAKEYQSANRYLSIVVNLIAACAVTFMSVIKDITGSFDLAYMILAVLCLVSAGLMLSIRHTYGEE